MAPDAKPEPDVIDEDPTKRIEREAPVPVERATDREPIEPVTGDDP